MKLSIAHDEATATVVEEQAMSESVALSVAYVLIRLSTLVILCGKHGGNRGYDVVLLEK